MLLFALVWLSTWQNQQQGDIGSETIRGSIHDLMPDLLEAAASHQDFAVDVSSDHLVIKGRGGAPIALNQVDGLIQRDGSLAIIAEVSLLENGYRSFATIVIREDENRLYSDRVWAISNDVSWRKSSKDVLILPIPSDLAVEQATVELYLYEKSGEIDPVLEVNKFAIHEITDLRDPRAELIEKLSEYVIIFVGLINVLIIYGASWLGLGNFPERYLPLTVALGGACVIASIALIDSFPINSLRIRADAWSFDIVARSLASGLGFRSYDLYEPTTYPLVPIYYGLAYKLAGISIVTIVWANIFLNICSWLLVTFLDGKFCLIRASTSLIIIAFWIVPWVNVPWALSGTLGAFTLTLLVWVALLVWRRRNLGNQWQAILLFGLVAAVAALARTEYYALVPLCLAYLLMCCKGVGLKNSLLIFVSSVALALLPWLIFQASVTAPTPEQQGSWATDASRIMTFSTSSFDYIVEEETLDQTLRRLTNNFVSLTSRPYSFYVYDVPASRPEAAAHHFHQFILLLFMVSTGVFLLNHQSRPAMVGLIITVLIFYRVGYLSIMSDTPRYFMTFAFIIAAHISEAFKSVILDRPKLALAESSPELRG